MRVWIPLTWRKGNWVDIHGVPVKRRRIGLVLRARRMPSSPLNAPTLTIQISYVGPRERRA